ncbi:UNVERIFIED_CONTAM: hypothetical protein O8I53_09560 [Campylobacter lari]
MRGSLPYKPTSETESKLTALYANTSVDKDAAKEIKFTNEFSATP